MTQKLNLRFEDMFMISTMSLRMNRSHPDIVRNKIWKLQFCVMELVAFIAFAFLCYSILCHDIISGKFAEASKNGTMIIVFITITLKYIALLIHQKSMKELKRFVEDDYNDLNNYSDEDKKTVLEYANKGVKVCKFWLVGGFGTCTMFPLKAFISMGYSYWQQDFKLTPMFELTYPEPIESYKNHQIGFCLLFLLAISFGIYSSSMYVGFDPLVPIFMLHACGQLEILSRRMGKIFISVENPREIEYELKSIITKLQSLYKFVNSVKGNFVILYEYSMKSTTFLIPLTAFQIVGDLRDGWINVEFISFFFGAFLHFFMPCYYSDMLMETSEHFRQAVYSSGWEKCPDKRIRRTILFMMTRAKITMGIRTVFAEINLDTFAEMCRQSYTIFNLMTAAWS